MIMTFTTVVVDVTSRIFLSEYLFELLLSRNPRSTHTTLHNLREFEVLIPWSVSWGEIELILYFIEEFLGNNRLIVSLTPISTSSRIFIYTVVHGIIEDRVYSRDDQWFPTSSPHRSFFEEKSLYGSTTHSFMSYFLKYELNVWSSLGIYSDFSTISEITSFICISKWCFMRKMSKFCFRLESSDNIILLLSFSSFAWEQRIMRRNFSLGAFLNIWPLVRISWSFPWSMRSTTDPRSQAFLEIIQWPLENTNWKVNEKSILVNLGILQCKLQWL